jgi:exodeoxyribonuclease V beta subunit
MTSGEVPEVRPFRIADPLPTGITVLEASAGTGKTFTIAALAARYVAEGIPLERVLLVTFTRMATGELRDRVRDRLVRVEATLSRALDGVPVPGGDEVLELIATGEHHEIERRRGYFSRALADFDAATIVTTHGFCQHVLAGLGIAGDVDREVVFVEDVGALVEEVVDDLYVRRFHRGDRVRFNRAEALLIGREAIAHRFAPVEPLGADQDSTPAMRRRLAEAVRQEVERRKRAAGILTYDDLLSRLRDTLADPVAGPAACARLADRYQIALVDEFQDTDPVQWEIMRRAFSTRTLVLIGDPKQAIYAFRGADVYAYLEAARLAGTRATLDTNWRSDQGLIDAYDALLKGTKLGHTGIAYRSVKAAADHVAPRLSGAPVAAPLRLRVLERDPDGPIPLTPKGYISAAPGRAAVAADLAADLAGLLASNAQIRPSPSAPPETVSPGHIAVLVRTHRQAAQVREALDALGIPAVINGAGSVFGTTVAAEWLRLLEALERPTSPGRTRSAALTVFVGWTAEQVAGAGEDEWSDLGVRLHRWASILRRRGVASLLETITQTTGLPERLLVRHDGERHLTDLRHVGQLLHLAAVTDQLGVGALAAWLRARIIEASADTANEERSRRLESDAQAVQVLTIHRSKGLEFPIAYFPYLWEPGYIPDTGPVVFHDAANNDERTIDVGLDGRDFDRHRSQYIVELRGEDLRLAYVALTRACHQAVVWWAGSWDSRNSPLARLLFARDGDGNVAAFMDQPPDDAEVLSCFGALAAEVPGCIAVETVDPRAVAPRWEESDSTPVELAAARFDRDLDEHWRRTSYSALTSEAHEARVTSEAEEPTLTDEPDLAEGDEPAVATTGPPSLLADMPAGADIGTFVHGVLEHTDFAAADLDAAVAAAVEAERSWRHLEIGDPATVVAGLTAALRTPLGPVAGGARLCDVTAADRLDELGFEFPLAGGDDPVTRLDLADVADLLDAYLPAADPVAGYAARLRQPGLDRELRGFLTGSIDLVLRRPDPATGTGRYAVVDYKTNWLGGELADYRPAALAAAMHRAHYPLQALLYVVALHRYLRWRLPGYSPDAHLSGVLYLFLRGMAGPDTPELDGGRCGVFSWQPPAALVTALSDLLDRGRVAA